MKKILFLFMFLSLFLGEKAYCCGLERFKGCTKVKKVGCCVPCPHSDGCCCVRIDVWLPTAAAYSVAESVYGADFLTGFGSEAQARGNVKIVKFKPEDVLHYGYGVDVCGGCRAIKASVRRLNTFHDREWNTSPNYGILHILKSEPWQKVPDLLERKVEDRLFASTLVWLVRALEFESVEPSEYYMSASPYQNSCPSIGVGSVSILSDFVSDRSDVWSNYGEFLNRFREETYSDFDRYAFAVSFDGDCSDSSKGLFSRPIYYIWEHYVCCVEDLGKPFQPREKIRPQPRNQSQAASDSERPALVYSRYEEDETDRSSEASDSVVSEPESELTLDSRGERADISSAAERERPSIEFCGSDLAAVCTELAPEEAALFRIRSGSSKEEPLTVTAKAEKESEIAVIVCDGREDCGQSEDLTEDFKKFYRDWKEKKIRSSSKIGDCYYSIRKSETVSVSVREEKPLTCWNVWIWNPSAEEESSVEVRIEREGASPNASEMGP